MSFTTTNMSAPRIWAFERGDAEWRIARDAGWHRSDLVWERTMEAANEAICGGHRSRALRLFLTADIVARVRFAQGDPRRATAPAARAVVLAAAGRTARAERLQRRALREWRRVDEFISGMEIRPRARSSLFHLRMEALHRDTYHDNLRLRLGKIAAETDETLSRLTARDRPPHRHFSRWRGEKPSVFDDTRKALAACLLFPDMR